MKGIDEKAMLKRHKNGKELYKLREGGGIIGQEVDEENRLVYVVKRENGKVEISYAEHEDIIPSVVQQPPITKRVTVSLKPMSDSKENI
jgi:hypothetical protein